MTHISASPGAPIGRTERRAAGRIRHRDVLAQRLYGLCCGYEDLNDHDALRQYSAIRQASVELSQFIARPAQATIEISKLVAQAPARILLFFIIQLAL